MEQTALYKAFTDKNEEEALKHLDDSDVDYSARNVKGETFLHVAVRNLKSIKIIKTLFAEVDFSIKDEEGESVVDLLLQDEEFPEEVEEVIQEVVKGRAMGSKKAELEGLLRGGWLDLWMKAGEIVGEDKEDLKQFVADRPAIVVSAAVIRTTFTVSVSNITILR